MLLQQYNQGNTNYFCSKSHPNIRGEKLRMSDLNGLISEQLFVIVGGIVVVVLWMLIWNFVQGSKLRKLRRKYEAMMQGTGINNLEDLLVDLKVQQDKIEDRQDEQGSQLQRIAKWMPKQHTKVGIKRYNAYNERGNDLSFSIALLNEDQDGFVITGLYSRDGSYVYAKAISKGESTHTLSPEEKEAITLAHTGGN